jgi:hypothetical protein
MTYKTWIVVARVNCGRPEPAELLEQRLYATDFLDDVGHPFRVLAQTCNQTEACREAGRRCCWTGLNPNYDPFRE